MVENKKETTKNKLETINLNRLVFEMIDNLPERSRDIVIKRFNLNGKSAQTLDEIGKEYEITRERIRQIEMEAIRNLKSVSKKYNLDKALDYLKEIVENYSGIMSEEKIIRAFLNNKKFKANEQTILFILSLDDKIKVLRENKIHTKIYFYKEEDVLKFKEVIEIIKKYLEEKKNSISFSEIVEIMNENIEVANSYLNANKIILKNILGEWGCAEWISINPKNIKDKAYLALKKNNKEALHFTEIANQINVIWPKKKQETNSQTTHNELIKDSRFILIGRGIYALQEWGYEQGTVLDVLLKIMSAENKSMRQEEIIKEVLNKRQVKRNTIILNLQNKKYFERLEGKIYRLK